MSDDKKPTPPEPKPTDYTAAQVQEQMTALRASLVKEHETAMATGVAAAAKQAAAEADAAAFTRVTDILVKCEVAKCSLAEAREMLKGNPSEEQFKDALIARLSSVRPPVGDAGGTDLGTKKEDPADKYRKEYKAAGGQAALGVTEEEFVQSCLRSDQGGTVGE